LAINNYAFAWQWLPNGSHVSPGMNKMIAQQFIYHFLNSMNLLSALNSLLPELHSYRDEDRRFHMGCTWHARDGLRELHDLELRYTYNSERLALQGEPRPDGSWCYTEPNGRIHTISAERARDFMESTHRSATVMVAMLDKLREAGVLDNTVEAEAQPI
jgi:hypothetical protein